MDKGNVLRARSNKLGLLLVSYSLIGIWTSCTENGHRTVDPIALEQNLTIGRLDQRLFNAPLESLPSVNAGCLLYTSDAADERSSVDLGGRRAIKKKK